MIIVRIQGGLGNQMFQYSYAKALELNGNKVKIDISNANISSQLDKYNIDLDIATDSEIKKLFSKNKIINLIHKIKKDVIKEKSLSFDEGLLNVKGDKYVYGYFQSEKYFLNIKDEILKQFKIKDDLSNYAKEIKQKITNTKNTCSIHIRRGDYVTNKSANAIHGTCSVEYYLNSIDIMNNKKNDIKYFIFSDDIKWAQENINIPNATYIDYEHRIPHEDIFLMSLCKNNIIANSSFSWWASWLNKNQDKIIIAPKRWFANENKNNESSKSISCNQWLRI